MNAPHSTQNTESSQHSQHGNSLKLPLLLGSLGSLGRPCRHRPSGSLGSFLCKPRHSHHHHRHHSHPYQHHDQNKYSQQHCYTNLNMLLEYPNTTSVLFFLFFVAPLSQKLWQNFCQLWNTDIDNWNQWQLVPSISTTLPLAPFSCILSSSPWPNWPSPACLTAWPTWISEASRLPINSTPPPLAAHFSSKLGLWPRLPSNQPTCVGTLYWCDSGGWGYLLIQLIVIVFVYLCICAQ